MYRALNQEIMYDSSMYVENLWFGSHSTVPTPYTITFFLIILNVIIMLYVLS